MNAATEGVQHDLHKKPEDLEREADAAREAAEDTLAAIERRLSPAELVDRIVDLVKRNGGDFGTNLATQVRNNPVPSVLAGIGITWLMAASDRAPRRHRASAHGAVGDTLSAAADSIRHAAAGTESAAKGAADAARGAAESASHAAGRIADATRNTAGTMASASVAGARSVAEGFTYLRREQPLVLGAVAVAAGALIGALLPSTESENRWVGDTSDAAAERLKRNARRSLEAVERVGAEAADEANQDLDEDAASRDEAKGPASPPPGNGQGPRVAH